MTGIPPLRIAQVAPPLERVPPVAYGGTERIVHELILELSRRGHEVTAFATGDSRVEPARLIPTAPTALRPTGSLDEAAAWIAATVALVARRGTEFDIVHSHLDWWGIALAHVLPVAVVTTFHGRIDFPSVAAALADVPRGLVAVSRHQASSHPGLPWTVIPNGLSLAAMPFGTERSDAFCFVGRVDPEKGIVEAIEIALLAGRPLRIAAKEGVGTRARAYVEEVFRPALRRAGSSVEYLGELSPPDRDRLFVESHATLMPGAWPEPFGLVAIESLATGTPIVARPAGALREIVRDGIDGVFGDDVRAMAFFSERIAGLDRAAIRRRAIETFSAERMADRYEALYARLLGLSVPPDVEAHAPSGDGNGAAPLAAEGVERPEGYAGVGTARAE